MVKYATKNTDENGCSHSIDNLVIDYIVGSFSVDTVLAEIGTIFHDCDPTWSADTCTKRDLPASSKYQFFRHTIWCKGFHISYGHYENFDRINREWDTVPILRLKFNPNKYTSSPVFVPLMAWIREWCMDGVIVKFDYAVDIPCRLEDLVVSTRKEPGLYQGTRYYGQRNQHGRVKIYDKAKEVATRDRTDPTPGVDPITRLEYTFCVDRPLGFDRILWLTRGPAPLPDVSELGSGAFAIVRTLRDLKASGGDVFQALRYFDRRTQKKIEPYTIGSGIQLFSCGDRWVVELLKVYCSQLMVSYRSGGVNPVVIGPDQLPEWLSLADLEDPDQLPDNFDDYEYLDELPI